MKILHLITTLDPGGAEHHLLDLAKRQKALGHQVSVSFLKGEGRLRPEFETAGIPIAKLPLESWPALPQTVSSLNNRLRAEQPDILHTHLLKADAVGALAHFIRPEITLVASKHNDESWLRNPILSTIHGFLSLQADRIIAISDWVARYMQTQGSVPSERIRRIYYGLDASWLKSTGSPDRSLRAEWGVKDDELLIGVVARLAPQKDPETALAVLRDLASRRPNVKLVWVGSAYDPAWDARIRALAKELGVANRVIFAGFRKDLGRVYPALDAFFLPSRWEGFGLVLLEAMASRIPIVASKASAIPEVVQDRVNGLLAAPGDVAGMSKALENVLTDAALRKKLIEEGERRVHTVFDPQRTATETLKVYDEALREYKQTRTILSWRGVNLFALGIFGMALPLSIAAVNFAWPLMLLAILFDPKRRQELLSTIPKHPLAKPWAIYLAAAVAAAVLGGAPLHSLYLIRTDLVKAAAFFTLLSALAYGRPGLSVGTFFFGGVVAALLGLHQVISAYPVYIYHAYGTIHHVTYGELMALGMVLALAVILFAQDFWKRLGMIGIAAALLGALLLSQARGAWIALGVSALTAVFFAPRKKILILCAAAAAVAVGSGAFLAPQSAIVRSVKERVSSIIDPAQYSNAQRLIAWDVGLQMWKDHPIFGVGPGQVRENIQKYRSEPISMEKRLGNLHNLYIHQLAERGALGLAALLWLFISMARWSWTLYREEKSAYRLAALCVLPGFFMMNVTETSFQHEVIGVTLCWLLALASRPSS